MKTLNFLVLAMVCISCAKINEGVSTSSNQITPKMKYPQVALTSTNLFGAWSWTCHTQNLLGLPVGKSFIENTNIYNDSFDTTIQVYSDPSCTVNAYTVKYSANISILTNPDSFTETRSALSVTPLSDSVASLLNDNANKGKNAFCGYVGWSVPNPITQYFADCKIPVSAVRDLFLYSNGTHSELILSACATNSSCVIADYTQ
jgi:hypothetical protein